MTSKVGLFWFCTECRVDLCRENKVTNEPNRQLMDDLSKRIGTIETRLRISGGLDDGSNCVDRTESAPTQDLLPVEMWTKVFMNLSVIQLRKVRMTCRSWNQIVSGCPKLMEKMVARLPKDIILDEECEQAKLLSFSKSRYVHFSISDSIIIHVDSWWPFVAETLESLSLSACQITITTLLTMLKPLHNLKSLTFAGDSCLDIRRCPIVLNFQLPSLETLILQDVNHSDTLDLFRQIFPQLKVFKLLNNSYTEAQRAKVVQLIETVKGTLEDVEVPMSAQLWDSIRSISGIRFKKISLAEYKVISSTPPIMENYLIELCQKHANIEALRMTKSIIQNEATLEAIARSLVHLKDLKLTIGGRNCSFNFLSHFLELTTLDIGISKDSYTHFKLDISNCRNDNLSSLNLTKVSISAGLADSLPNIRVIKLIRCELPCWSIVFDPQLKALQSVTLESVEILNKQEYLADYCEQLRSLSISQCKIPRKFLVAIFTLCPKLNVVNLEKLDNIDDDVVLILSLKLKNLQKVSIISCGKTTKLSVKYILKNNMHIESCKFLENYNVMD